MTPPTYEELTHEDPAYQEVFKLLLGQDIVQLDRYTFLKRSVYEHAVKTIIAHIKEHGAITLAETRDLFDTSRKFALKILEHLDEEGKTVRQDDQRVLK